MRAESQEEGGERMIAKAYAGEPANLARPDRKKTEASSHVFSLNFPSPAVAWCRRPSSTSDIFLMRKGVSHEEMLGK